MADEGGDGKTGMRKEARGAQGMGKKVSWI